MHNSSDMNSLKDNNCRICRKTFCCKKCREEHETLIHEISDVDCNICVYGRTFLKRDTSDCRIKHIKRQHWPLYCLFCKYIFSSFEELFLIQNRCHIGYKNLNFEKSPSVQSWAENQYESPSFFPKGQLATANTITMFTNLATSTPLQREENNSSEKSNQEAITPVEYSEINKNANHFNKCVSMKRKVTFCETPRIETYKKEKSMPGGVDKFDSVQFMVTPSPGDDSAVFYSATQYSTRKSKPRQGNEDELKNIYINKKYCVENEKKKEDKKNVDVQCEESTIWISANNMSPVDILEGSKPLVEIKSTPVIGKLKKRQINVVSPISIGKKEVQLPINMQLTTVVDSFENQNGASAFPQMQDNKSHELFEPKCAISSISEESINTTSGLWSSVTKLVKNVTHAVQEFSSIACSSKTPLKRCILEVDPLDGPCAKRYKLTKIKCRRPIREVANIERLDEFDKNYRSASTVVVEIKKTFIDKATQTEEVDLLKANSS